MKHGFKKMPPPIYNMGASERIGAYVSVVAESLASWSDVSTQEIDGRVISLDHLSIRDRIFSELSDRVASEIEAEMKRMLGIWVSGEDPVVFRDGSGDILGLGRKGSSEILVPAKKIAAPQFHVESKI
jgi:hypothetical protein